MASREVAVVADTSVILKLFFEEADSGKAILLFQNLAAGTTRILIPDIVPAEFINVLWVKYRQRQADAEECRTILGLFTELVKKLEIVPTMALAAEVLDDSIHYDHACYDILFVALGKRLEVPLVTADAALCRKLAPHTGNLILLRDYQ